MIDIIFVCGMSGAGKTTAQNTLEDLGYMCIDNMPPTFISMVVDLITKQEEIAEQKIGFIFDIKFHSVKLILEAYNKLKKESLENEQKAFAIRLFFLDAQDDELLGRYRETRRKHPLASAHVSLAEGIIKERTLLAKMKENADIVLDTTGLNAKELTKRMNTLFGSASDNETFNIRFVSFGFKYGIPKDADFVLDVRFLPNPFYVEAFRVVSGQHQEVADYVLDNTAGQEFLEKTIEFLSYLFAQYKKDKRNQFVVAIGCTGGQHRSVAITEYLYHYYQNTYTSFVQHRDMEKNQLEIKARFQLK